MKTLLTEPILFLMTLLSLALFQGLAFALAPVELHGGLALVCLAWDGLLLTAFLRARGRRERSAQARSVQVNQVLIQLFELTRDQQKHWKTIVEGVTDLETDDPEAQESLRSLAQGLQRIEFLPAAPGADGNTSVESIIDAIQTILLLNHSLMADFNAVLAFYHRTYDRLREIRMGNRLNHFRLHESVDFLRLMGQETNGYSERLVLDILGSFQDITRFSKGIGTDVVMTINILMDNDNPEGLQSVIRESSQIKDSTDRFFADLGKAITFSERSVADNLAQMDRVKTISEAIADFSESIRMISLNLNIEAARGTQSGASGRGFQVLATKLSEFAVKAQELAGQQQEIIGRASEVLTQSGQVQLHLLQVLKTQVPTIRNHVEPFERIVKETFHRFEGVVATMESLSTSIDDRLKAVIGKFQFQDLVRQEQEHLLAMFGHIRDLAEQVSGVDTELDPGKKMEALNDLIHFYECLASTVNERAVIEAYRKNHPNLSPANSCNDVESGSVQLF